MFCALPSGSVSPALRAGTDSPCGTCAVKFLKLTQAMPEPTSTKRDNDANSARTPTRTPCRTGTPGSAGGGSVDSQAIGSRLGRGGPPTVARHVRDRGTLGVDVQKVAELALWDIRPYATACRPDLSRWAGNGRRRRSAMGPARRNLCRGPFRRLRGVG